MMYYFFRLISLTMIISMLMDQCRLRKMLPMQIEAMAATELIPAKY